MFLLLDASFPLSLGILSLFISAFLDFLYLASHELG